MSMQTRNVFPRQDINLQPQHIRPRHFVLQLSVTQITKPLPLLFGGRPWLFGPPQYPSGMLGTLLRCTPLQDQVDSICPAGAVGNVSRVSEAI